MHRLELYPNKELMQKYRNVFSHREASDVVYHIMTVLGVIDNNGENTAEDKALRSFGTYLLTILGGGEIGKQAVDKFIKGLISQPIPTEKKED